MISSSASKVADIHFDFLDIPCHIILWFFKLETNGNISIFGHSMHNRNWNRVISKLRNIVHNRNISSIRSLLNDVLKDLRLSGSVLRLGVENLKTHFFVGNGGADCLLFVDCSSGNSHILNSSGLTKLRFTHNRVVINGAGSRILYVQSHVFSLIDWLDHTLAPDGVRRNLHCAYTLVVLYLGVSVDRIKVSTDFGSLLDLYLLANCFGDRLHISVVGDLVAGEIHRLIDDLGLVLNRHVDRVLVDKLVLSLHELRLSLLKYVHDCWLSDNSLPNGLRNVFGDVPGFCANSFGEDFRWSRNAFGDVARLLIDFLNLSFVIRGEILHVPGGCVSVVTLDDGLRAELFYGSTWALWNGDHFSP